MKSFVLLFRRVAALICVFCFVMLCLVPHILAQQDLESAKALFNSGAEAYIVGNLSGAIEAWSKAIKILKRIPDTELKQADWYNKIGVVLGKMGKYEEEIGKYNKALEIYESIKGTEGDQAYCYKYIGAALLDMSKYEEAIAKGEEALQIYESIKGTEEDQAYCYKYIGAALLKMGRYEESKTKQEQALQIYQSIKGTEWDRAACYMTIGIVLGKMSKYEEEIGKYNKALEIYESIKGTEGNQAYCYKYIGIALGKMGKYEEEIGKYNKALQIYESIKGTEEDQAYCYKNIGVALGMMGKYEEAIEKEEEALQIYESIKGTEWDQAYCYKYIGAVLMEMGKYEEAIEKGEAALQIYQSIKGTERDQAYCYENIGVALGKMGKYEEAIEKEEEALQIYQTIKGTEQDRADCLANIGVALEKMGKPEEGIEKGEAALQIYQTIKGTEQSRALCTMNIGAALLDMGKNEEAIKKEEEALQIYQTIKGTEKEQADCYVNIGIALGNMGKSEEEIGKYNKALQIYENIKGTERDWARCYMNLGASLLNMGMYEDTIATGEAALQIYESIKGTERNRARCYMNIGAAFLKMGKYEEAIKKEEAALQIYESIKGTERDRAQCYNLVGLALLEIGKYEEAIEKGEAALQIYQSIEGTERNQGYCYSIIGGALGNMDKYEEEIAKQEQALEIYQAIIGTELEQRSSWSSIGDAHLRTGQLSKAIVAYEKAGLSTGALWGLGYAYRLRSQLGDEQLAVRALWDAVQLTELERSFAFAFEHRAVIFRKSEKLFPDFVSLIVELAAKDAIVQEPEVLRWVQDEKSKNALLEAAFHFADRGKGRAMEDALREKAAMNALQPDIKLLAEDRELSLRISKLTSMREELPVAEVERRQKLTHGIDALQQRRNMIEVELKRTALGSYVSPEFRKPMEMVRELSPQTAVLQYSVGEKEGWLLVLQRDGVSAHYLGVETAALPGLLFRQDATLGQLLEAWRVRPEKVGLDGLVRLARERAIDLGKKREKRHNHINAEQERAILERLGEAVLPESVLSELRQRDIQQLLVIPDGSLHYVPFAMLRIKGSGEEHYLIEDFSISYIPAMTTLETVRKQKQEREQKRVKERRWLLAFANPDFGVPDVPLDDMTILGRLYSVRSDYYKGSGLHWTPLPETEKEAVRVGSLFGKVKKLNTSTLPDSQSKVVVYTSKGASEEQVKQLLTRDTAEGQSWRYLLFSTHGLADPQNGMLSCIALSLPTRDSEEDGILQAQEVLNLQLDCDLVMLSACQTGLGRMRGGEGLVGLSTAFFYAGTESVCASLWSVPSGPTSQLVWEFFRRLKEGKVDKAEALRQAQSAVMRSGRNPEGKRADYSTPFCWAAFVLVGE